MRAALFLMDLVCFASFGWAMSRHFQKAGKPKPCMVLTGAIAPLCAVTHLAALLVRPLAQPFAAVILYIASAALFWYAIQTTRGKGLAACFQQHVTPVVVKTGPYRFIRHPFYTSYALAWLAGFAATGWWPLAVIAMVMAGLYCRAARQEEEGFLRSPLSVEYRRYMRETGRLNIGSARSDRSGSGIRRD